MASYGAGKYGRAGDAIVVQGFTELQRSLKIIEDGAQAQVNQRLKVIGEYVKRQAAKNVTHNTGRRAPGGAGIEENLRVAPVTLRGASIYTTALHGGVQNVGGGPHAGWAARGPHVKRASASHYMDKAVRDSAPFVEQETLAVLDWINTTFQGA